MLCAQSEGPADACLLACLLLGPGTRYPRALCYMTLRLSLHARARGRASASLHRRVGCGTSPHVRCSWTVLGVKGGSSPAKLHLCWGGGGERGRGEEDASVNPHQPKRCGFPLSRVVHRQHPVMPRPLQCSTHARTRAPTGHRSLHILVAGPHAAQCPPDHGDTIAARSIRTGPHQDGMVAARNVRTDHRETAPRGGAGCATTLAHPGVSQGNHG